MDNLVEIVGGKVLVDNFGGIFLLERFIHFEDSTQTFQGSKSKWATLSKFGIKKWMHSTL